MHLKASSAKQRPQCVSICSKRHNSYTWASSLCKCIYHIMQAFVTNLRWNIMAYPSKVLYSQRDGETLIDAGHYDDDDRHWCCKILPSWCGSYFSRKPHWMSYQSVSHLATRMDLAHYTSLVKLNRCNAYNLQNWSRCEKWKYLD